MVLNKLDHSFFRYYFVKSWQILNWFILYIPIRLLFNVKLESEIENNVIKNPTLIVSNHATLIDPWLITMILPIRVYAKLAPIRALATQRFNSKSLNIIYRLIVKPFIYLPNGVILLPDKANSQNILKKEKLQTLVDPLKTERANILIFPEGKVAKHDKLSDFKDGFAHLIKEGAETILFVSIKNNKHFKVNWSKVYSRSEFLGLCKSNDIQDIKSMAYNIVDRLYSR